LVDIVRSEGARGLSRGLVASLFGVSQGALQFMLYEELKYAIDERGVHNDATIFAAASASKMFSVLGTYPYQVVRTRMQDSAALLVDGEQLYGNVRGTVRSIYSREV
jgi:solute carrier family 25 folate transporter 32